MLLVFLFVLGFLSQQNFCDEIEDNVPVENEFLDENMIEPPADVNDDTQETSDIPIEDDAQIEPEEENSEENDDNESVDEVAHVINFAGPVNAKGTVAVGATFGYDSPINPIAFPPYPCNFYPNFYPMPFYPMIPPVYSHIPLLSMFLPQGSPEYQYLESLLDKEAYLEVTPLHLGVYIPDVKNVNEYPDLEDFPQIIPDDEESNDDDKTGAGGVVFGGMIPASGTVTIAAKF